MDDATTAPNEIWSQHRRVSGRPTWQSSCPIIIYDLAFDPLMQPGHGRRRAGLLWRLSVVWLGALALGGGIGGAMAWCNPNAYSATGLLLGLSANDAAQDELALISSDEVMRAVTQDVGAEQVAPNCGVFDPECPVDAVKTRLHAERAGGDFSTTSGLRITAVHPDPATAVAMVDAAIAADRRFWHLAHPSNRAGSLQPQMAAAEAALDCTTTQLIQLRAASHVTDIAHDTADAIATVQAIARQDDALVLRQAAVGAQLAIVRAALQTAPNTVLDSREITSGDHGEDSRAMLLQLKLDRAHMAQLYAPEYTGLAELNRKIAMVEAAMKSQAKDTKSVIRDVRNPIVALLSAQAVSLAGDAAGLVQQRAELEHQASSAGMREAQLRGLETRLALVQKRQGVEDAVFRNISVEAAKLQAQDTLVTAQLAERRLLRRPVAVLLPWTGLPVAVVAGLIAALAYGVGMTAMGRRRRPFYAVIRASSEILLRIERDWARHPVPSRRASDPSLQLAGFGEQPGDEPRFVDPPQIGGIRSAGSRGYNVVLSYDGEFHA